jgi:hypothetical protein
MGEIAWKTAHFIFVVSSCFDMLDISHDSRTAVLLLLATVKSPLGRLPASIAYKHVVWIGDINQDGGDRPGGTSHLLKPSYDCIKCQVIGGENSEAFYICGGGKRVRQCRMPGACTVAVDLTKWTRLFAKRSMWFPQHAF